MKTTPISSKLHGALDYIAGISQAVAPGIMGYDYSEANALLPLLLGIIIIIYSLFTDYELSLYRLIPMKSHLLLDIMAAIVLFFFSGISYPGTLARFCLVLSVVEMFVVILTVRPQHSNAEKNRREYFREH